MPTFSSGDTGVQEGVLVFGDKEAAMAETSLLVASLHDPPGRRQAGHDGLALLIAVERERWAPCW
jgi:hypothetical protein